MTDIQKAGYKALELIMLQRAKQQAYWLLNLQSTEFRGEYFDKAMAERDILEAMIDVAVKTGLVDYQDVDIWNIKLVEQSPE